jgi:hypothetical protein
MGAGVSGEVEGVGRRDLSGLSEVVLDCGRGLVILVSAFIAFQWAGL